MDHSQVLWAEEFLAAQDYMTVQADRKSSGTGPRKSYPNLHGNMRNTLEPLAWGCTAETKSSLPFRHQMTRYVQTLLFICLGMHCSHLRFLTVENQWKTLENLRNFFR
jgi:hypothetical protein